MKNDFALRKLTLIMVCFMTDRISLYLACHLICFDTNLAEGHRGKVQAQVSGLDQAPGFATSFL